MLPSERLAIAARLHVLLRRKTGRVTDTEWLAVNAEYAAEIVRFARERALEPGMEDVAEWAGRLEQAQPGHVTSVREHLVNRLTPEQVAQLANIMAALADEGEGAGGRSNAA